MSWPSNFRRVPNLPVPKGLTVARFWCPCSNRSETESAQRGNCPSSTLTTVPVTNSDAGAAR
jgi:hypothetical protein